MNRLFVVVVLCLSLAGCDKKVSFEDERSRALENRIASLEAELKRANEVLDFIRPFMDEQRQAEEARAATEPDPNVRFAVGVEGSPAIGSSEASVTVVKAFDFACPYCEQIDPLLEDLVDKYAPKVRVVYKNFVVHPEAEDAHLAACAAAAQGKFKEFKTAFWQKGFRAYVEARDPDKLGKTNILAIATELGMDAGKLDADMSGETCKALVKNDMEELNKFGVNGTPSFFVNGKFTMFAGPQAFQELIDAELVEVEKSGVAGADYYRTVVMAKGEKAFKASPTK